MVFIVGLAILATQLRTPHNPFPSPTLPSPAGKGAADRLLLMLGAVVVILWLLQMDYFGTRPWRAVWAAIPGAKAIRYTFRSQLVANLFVSLVVARVLAAIRRARSWAWLLCAVLIVEQINLAWPAVLSRRAALAWIHALPPPTA